MGRLQNRVALITGGCGDSGREICRLFAKEGASVMITDLNEKFGEELVNEIKENGGSAAFYKADVTQE